VPLRIEARLHNERMTLPEQAHGEAEDRDQHEDPSGHVRERNATPREGGRRSELRLVIDERRRLRHDRGGRPGKLRRLGH